MRIFKTGSYTWWQVGFLKLALLSFGIVIGAYWAPVFVPYIPGLLLLGIALGMYCFVVWIYQ